MIFGSLTAADVQTVNAVRSVLDTAYHENASLHHKKFARRKAGDLAATMSPTFSSNAFDVDSGITTEADRSDDEISSLGDSACYVLSLGANEDDLPCQREIGWWFGTGDLERFPENAGVDILIPPAGVRYSQRQSSVSNTVYPRQGYFAFDRAYGQLWLHARHRGIRVDGRPLARQSKALLSHRSRIAIGPFRFIFEFKVSNEQEFQRAKKNYLSKFLNNANPHESTSVTPSVNDVQIQDWRLHGVVGTSAITVIHAATNVKSGEVVAVKRLRFDSTNKAEAEVSLYAKIRSSVINHRSRQFVMQMHDLLRHERPFSSVHEVYLLWKPLARGDFSQFGIHGLWRERSEALKRLLFVQALFGLLALHESGWIHRDIKPPNLGVVELEPTPRAVIMDEGQAILQGKGHTPRIGHCGTVGFLAPELENSKFSDTYDAKIDIWSMGAVAYFLFLGGRLPWSLRHNMFIPEKDALDPSLQTFREILAGLVASPIGLERLIGQMLCENPRQRPSISQIIAHSEFQAECEVIGANLPSQQNSGQKRNASSSQSRRKEEDVR